LEPVVTSVSDDGVLLHRFITDAFNVLRGLTEEEGDKQTFSFLALLGESQLKEIAEDDRHYEKEWEELIAQYRACVRNYVRS
jgi:ferritin